jgi:hypothetical protein
MEPSGRNRWQPVANAPPPKTAQTSRSATRGNPRHGFGARGKEGVDGLVAGSSGFAATAPRGALPAAPLPSANTPLPRSPLVEFGYLTVTVDMSKRTPTLTINVNDRTKHEDT